MGFRERDRLSCTGVRLTLPGKSARKHLVCTSEEFSILRGQSSTSGSHGAYRITIPHADGRAASTSRVSESQGAGGADEVRLGRQESGQGTLRPRTHLAAVLSLPFPSAAANRSVAGQTAPDSACRLLSAAFCCVSVDYCLHSSTPSPSFRSADGSLTSDLWFRNLVFRRTGKIGWSQPKHQKKDLPKGCLPVLGSRFLSLA